VVFLLGACSPSTMPPAGPKPGAPIAAVAAPEGTAPPPRVAMKAAYTATASSMAPMWLAKEQGLFADQGLDVELVLVQPGPPVLAALQSGDAAFAIMGAAAAVPAALGGSDHV